MNRARKLAIALTLGALLLAASGCFYAGAAGAAIASASGGGGSSSKGNALPVATLTQPTREVDGDIDVVFVLRDDDAELLDITVEYSVAGSGTYQSATTAVGSTTTGLQSNDQGVQHTFVWDYATDLGTGSSDVTVRVTPIDKKGVGSADESVQLVVGNDAPAVAVVSPSPAVTASTIFAGSLSFEYDLTDSSADVATLTAEFSVDSVNYFPATTQSSLTTGLLPGRHSYVWDSTVDLLSSTFEGSVDFRLRADDIFVAGLNAVVTLTLDNNAPPRVQNLFDATEDDVNPVLIPFIIEDDEADTIQVIIQYAIQPQAVFPDLDDPAQNPYIDPGDILYVGDSIEDPAVRTALLADPAVRRSLNIISEARPELRAIAGVMSTLSLLSAPHLNLVRPTQAFEGATVVVGLGAGANIVTAIVNGLDFDLSPPLPPAAAPVPGEVVQLLIPEVQGRGIASDPAGVLHAALWDCARDLPADRTVAIRVTAFDSQAGPDASSVRVDRGIRGNLVVYENAAVGDGPVAVTAGDFNMDGRDDLAVANSLDGTVSVLLTGSLGRLENGSVLVRNPAGLPVDVASGDLNDDGRDDLVAVSPVAGTNAIFLQDGFGVLATVPVSVTTGATPSAVTVGDLNDDNLDDLVIASGPGEISVYLQAPITGIPAAATVTLITAEVPAALRVGDLDNDGLEDLAAVNPLAETVTVYLQTVVNTLPALPSMTLAVGAEPVALAIGNLDADTLNDLAVANRTDETVSVLYQNAGGGFAAPVDFDAGEGASSVAIADVNGDAVEDLVVVNADEFTVLAFLREAVGLPSEPSAVLPGGEFPAAIAIGDLGGDGENDIAVVNQGDPGDPSVDSVTVYVSDPPGRLSDVPAASLNGSFGPEGLQVADVNGDGRGDLTVVTASETIAVYYQDPVGALPATPSVTIDVGDELDDLAIGDVNHDGRSDIVVEGEDDLYVYLQGPTGILPTTPSVVLSGALSPEKIAIGDLNGDGRNDIATVGDVADFYYVFLQDGAGNLPTAPSASYASGPSPDSIQIGDLNADGRDDVMITNPDDDEVRIFYQTALGTLPAVEDLTLSTIGAAPEEGRIGDLNSDGLNDVAVLNFDDGEIDIFFNSAGTGLPTTPSLTLAPGPGSEAFAIGDLDGNGRDDLVVTIIDTGMSAIYLQDLNGLTTQPNQQLDAGSAPDAQAVGDLNGDGRWDLAVSNDGEFGVPADNIIRVYLQE